jgi:rod shape-determining protein MreC
MGATAHSFVMRPDRYTYSYGSGGSARSMRARLMLALLVVGAVALLVMARFGHPSVAQLRVQMGDWLRPIMQTFTVPATGIRNLMENKDALFRAYEENKQLREENDTLRHWQAVAETLKAENESLRALAAYRPVENVAYVAAHVIAQSPDAYAGNLMIDAGSAQGLKSLQPVVDAFGLVGRLVDVGERTARVLLLSDTSSHVPVISGDSRQHAILVGTGDELLRMTFIGGDPQQIQLGESVMTTSEGGLIPDSVMVGRVFRRDGNELLVKPLRPLARSEYVRVMVTK